MHLPLFVTLTMSNPTQKEIKKGRKEEREGGRKGEEGKEERK